MQRPPASGWSRTHRKAGRVVSRACPCSDHSAGSGSISPGNPRSVGHRPSRIASTMSRREQRQLQHTTEIAAVDLLRRSHLADRGVAPFVQKALVSECSRQRLHQRLISPRREGRRAAVPHRCHHRLPPRPSPDGQRHLDRDAAGRARSTSSGAPSMHCLLSRQLCQNQLREEVHAEPDIVSACCSPHLFLEALTGSDGEKPPFRLAVKSGCRRMKPAAKPSTSPRSALGTSSASSMSCSRTQRMSGHSAIGLSSRPCHQSSAA